MQPLTLFFDIICVLNCDESLICKKKELAMEFEQ